MNSRAGSGEYSSTSTGPSSPASDVIAAARSAAARMSTARNATVRPSAASAPASASSLAALRETSPTAIPSPPKRRATAAPRSGPAPTMTIDIVSAPGAVLLVGDVLAPGDRAAGLVGFCCMAMWAMKRFGRGAVPVVLAGLEEDPVAGADLLDRAALALA